MKAFPDAAQQLRVPVPRHIVVIVKTGSAKPPESSGEISIAHMEAVRHFGLDEEKNNVKLIV
jgi:hypothetical protein